MTNIFREKEEAHRFTETQRKELMITEDETEGMPETSGRMTEVKQQEKILLHIAEGFWLCYHLDF